MSKDLFKEPFGESTKLKLSLFKDYLESWLYIFLARKPILWNEINIFDFFSGQGKDVDGEYGSPVIIINEIIKKQELIRENNIKVNIFLNEFKKSNYIKLVKLLENHKNEDLFNLKVTNNDFAELFSSYHKILNDSKSANLIFLDQYGIKNITEEIFLNLISYKTTDFIFFISSSTISRFYDVPIIKKYLNVQNIKLSNYEAVHRNVTNYYKNLIPGNIKYFLGKFSLKKDSNIYGLIFGTHHLKGIYRFLKICWDRDPLRGEANYNIDNEEIDNNKPSLFPEDNIPQKLKYFENDIVTKILNKELLTDKDVATYSLVNGFLPQQCRNIINKLKENSLITKQRYSFSEHTIDKEYKPKFFK